MNEIRSYRSSDQRERVRKSNRAASANREPSLSAGQRELRAQALGRRRKKIKALFDQNPTIRIVDVARTIGASCSVVYWDVEIMRREGVLPERPTPEVVAFGPAIRAAILDDPTATKAEIAKICGCSVNAVDQVRRKMRERNEISRCDPHEEPFNALEDQRVLREPWYVAEVCGRGFPGMKLPQEYWARYLRFYEMKKKGILL